MAIRVLIADDHALFRAGVRSELEKHDDIEVVGEADDGLMAVNLAHKLTPDLVIMDVGMPKLNGIEAARRVKSELPDTMIIGLSVHHESYIVKGFLAAGASGFLLKTSLPSVLVKSVREVAAGKGFLSPEVAKDIVSEFWDKSKLGQDEGELGLLTPREREVAQLLVEGKKTRDVAELLHISVKTVETHRKQIMDKLDIHSLPELTRWAIRNGLSELG